MTDVLPVDSIGRYADMAIALGMQYVPQVLLAVIVLYGGFKIVGMVTTMLDGTLRTQRVDASLASFLHSAVGAVLKILVLMTVANMIGVQMTSFVAFVGAIGLAIGLSLQGSLSNLAGGILVLFFKPFTIGDTIISQGQQGVVSRIEMFCTVLSGEGGRTIIIPNGALSNGVIVNLGSK